MCAIKVSTLKNNKDMKSGYNNLEDSIRKKYVELYGKIDALKARIGVLKDVVDPKIGALEAGIDALETKIDAKFELIPPPVIKSCELTRRERLWHIIYIYDVYFNSH